MHNHVHGHCSHGVSRVGSQLGAERSAVVRNISFLGALVNTLLGISKVVVGTLAHSHALFADGIHSFADLLTDALVIFAARWGGQVADEDHPYGHGRIETVAAVVMAVLLTFVGIVLILNAVDAFSAPTHEVPTSLAVIMAVLAILVKEGLFHYTRYIAVKVHSDLLKASAWHHRSDAASSGVVLLGVIASSWFSVDYIDSFAAVVVGMLIIKMGWDIGWRGLQELIDTAVDTKTLAKLEETITQVPGVMELHDLRTRYVANKIFLDVHILVNEKMSVSEGHFISERVHHALYEAFPLLEDVVVHVDPEDDHLTPIWNLSHDILPDRQTLLSHMASVCEGLPGYSLYEKATTQVVLHYLDNKIDIDIHLDSDWLSTENPDVFRAELLAALKNIPVIRDVRLLVLL